MEDWMSEADELVEDQKYDDRYRYAFWCVMDALDPIAYETTYTLVEDEVNEAFLFLNPRDNRPTEQWL